MGEAKGTSWRDLIKVHPAAEMFPLMGPEEFKSLVEDIRANGLRAPIAIWHGGENEEWLLDGRNRLNAMAELGYQFEIYRSQKSKFELLTIRDASGLPVPQRVDLVPLDDDPYAFVISANIRRRHLTADQKRELIEKLLKAKPERSDRATAKLAKVDNKTVAGVRRDLEAGAEIPHLEERVGRDGKKQPAKKADGKSRKQPTKSAVDTEELFQQYKKLAAEGEDKLAEAEALRIELDAGTGAETVLQTEKAEAWGHGEMLATMRGHWRFLTAEEQAEFLEWAGEHRKSRWRRADLEHEAPQEARGEPDRAEEGQAAEPAA